jgi:hypothetical protein
MRPPAPIFPSAHIDAARRAVDFSPLAAAGLARQPSIEPVPLQNAALTHAVLVLVLEETGASSHSPQLVLMACRHTRLGPEMGGKNVGEI